MNRVNRSDRQACPSCNTYVFDAHSSVMGDDARPEPGDFSICFSCGATLVFTGGLRLRLPTHSEFLESLSIPELVAARALIAERDR